MDRLLIPWSTDAKHVSRHVDEKLFVKARTNVHQHGCCQVGSCVKGERQCRIMTELASSAKETKESVGTSFKYMFLKL